MVLFQKCGKENTQKTAEIALQAARDTSIRHIVVASATGNTAKLFAGIDGIETICITHAYGFEKKGEIEMSAKIRDSLTAQGLKVHTSAHVLSGAERGLSKKFGGVNPVEVIAHSLRMFGQGTKVCVEVAVMALDAGLIPFGEAVIAVGGTNEGADTALVIIPSYSASILDTRIITMLCKPAEW